MGRLSAVIPGVLSDADQRRRVLSQRLHPIADSPGAAAHDGHRRGTLAPDGPDAADHLLPDGQGRGGQDHHRGEHCILHGDAGTPSADD